MNRCAHHDYTQFEEEYYGYRCPKCGLLIPYGCEPWVEPSEPDGTTPDDDYDWHERWHSENPNGECRFCDEPSESRPVCQDCGEKALPGYVAGDRCERLAKRNACVPETVCGGRLDEPCNTKNTPLKK